MGLTDGQRRPKMRMVNKLQEGRVFIVGGTIPCCVSPTSTDL